MKRAHPLRRLSSEHHRALVLAKLAIRIARFGDATRVAETCREAVGEFEALVAPHFREEEIRLLPLLRAVGELELAERTEGEHRQLRDLVALLECQPTREALLAFAEALTAHIRFEERLLFETAQQRLSTEALAAAMANGNPGSS